jgi:hypothetical protein
MRRARGATGRLMYDGMYSLTIGFMGTVLWLAVHEFEADWMMGNILKFLVVFFSCVTILHRLRPYGLSLF